MVNNHGLKKLAFKPLSAKVLIAAATIRTPRSIPKEPSTRLKHQIIPFVRGFLIASHMKQGYAYVTGTSVIPPSRAARLGKKGNATAIKNANPPKNNRKHILTHCGHFLFFMLVYLNSRLSKTGMAYTWKLHKQCTITRTYIAPIENFDN